MTRTAAPAKLPLTLDEVKDHLNLPHSETDDDAKLDAMIRQAVRWGEQIAGDGVCLVSQTWAQVEENWPRHEFELRRGPVQSVTSIVYKDAAGADQTLATSVYQTSLGAERRRARVKLDDGESWPTLGTAFYDPVTITIVCGFGFDPNKVPEELRRDLLDWIGSLYNDREAWIPGKEGVPQNPISGSAFAQHRLNWF